MPSTNHPSAAKGAMILLSLAMIAGAKVPNTFSVGQPARSAEVNANFSYLDTSISKKSDRASLDSLGAILQSKSDTSVSSSIRSELSTTRSELMGMKAQVVGLKDEAWVLERISDTADGLRNLMGGNVPGAFPRSFQVQGPNDFINGAPWYGLGLSDIARGPNFLVQLGGYYGLNLQTGGGYPIRLNSADHPIADFGYDESILFASDKKVAIFDATGMILSGELVTSGSLAVGGNLDLEGSITAKGDLNVAGSVTAKAITPVPDYVFEPSYKLASLAEVEAFTSVHRHLPEIPPASEIESKGVDLAEMNLLLLKKVEELTLHAIAQEKRLHSQESTISTQEDRLRALEGKLRNLDQR